MSELVVSICIRTYWSNFCATLYLQNNLLAACKWLGRLVRRSFDTFDLRRASHCRWLSVRRDSTWTERVEPPDPRHHTRRPGPIQVHRKHLTCEVEGRHAPRQRSVVHMGLRRQSLSPSCRESALNLTVPLCCCAWNTSVKLQLLWRRNFQFVKTRTLFFTNLFALNGRRKWPLVLSLFP